MTTTITKQQLMRLYDEMNDVFGVRYVDGTGWVDTVIRWVYKRVMRKCPDELPIHVRPCCLGRYVLLPWELGDSSVDYWRQARVLVHEVEHSRRIKLYPGSVFGWYREYFTRPEFRALEETIARCTVADFVYGVSGKLPSSINLDGYVLPQIEIDRAEARFQTHLKHLEKFGPGATMSPVARVALEVLRAR